LEEIHVEVTQSQEITFRVDYVNAIMFAKISRENCPVCPVLVAALAHGNSSGIVNFAETFIAFIYRLNVYFR